MTNQEQIDNIMQEFNFVTVKSLMEALDWKWLHDDLLVRIPNISTIRKEAIELLVAASKYSPDQVNAVSTGGFVAENNKGWLSLSFVIEEWSANPNT